MECILVNAFILDIADIVVDAIIVCVINAVYLLAYVLAKIHNCHQTSVQHYY